MTTYSDNALGLSQQKWTEVPFNHVVLAFLRAEWNKIPVVAKEHIDHMLIDHPDLSSPEENERRSHILRSHRAPLLDQVPEDTKWYQVDYLTERHLDELLVIGRCGWDAGSDKNELLQVARRKIIGLRKQPDQWAAPIFWGHGKEGPFTILEGNNRLVALARMNPIPPLKCVAYIGLSLNSCHWHIRD